MCEREREVKVKVNFNLEQATKAQRGRRCIAVLLTLTSALGRGRWSMPHPGRFTPGKLNTYAFDKRLDEPGDRAGRKILVTTLFGQPFFEIQPVVRYGKVHDVSEGC